MENKENWYLHASWKKPRPLSRMKVRAQRMMHGATIWVGPTR
jgi:hypothetical protein